jgi:hypothetical protein
MGNFFSSPACPACPTCPACPACICQGTKTDTVCPVCPKCPICTKCPDIEDNCNKDYIKLGVDSDDSIIDITNTKKQVLLPSSNIPLYGLLNMPVSYVSPLYGNSTFYWEGNKPINITNNILFNKIINMNATLDNVNYNTIWNARYMFKISNTTVINTKPTKYIVLKLPINPNTHNSIFIQTITRDRWSNINMYVCDNITNIPVKKVFTNCNSSRGVTGNSSFLGPMNSVAQQGHHEWLQFSLSIDTINTYKTSNNEICVSINAGINNTDSGTTSCANPVAETGVIFISGVAVVSNKYAVTTMRALNLHWNSNSNVFIQQTNGTWNLEGITFNNNAWNEESLVHLVENKICKINVPIVSKDQDLIFGIITHNANWYDTSPMIYVDDTLYYLSQLISGRYGFSLQGRGLYRYAKGIFIKKDVINKIKKTDSEGIDYIEIIINQSKESVGLHIRGMFTEAVQEYIKS